MTDQGWPGQGSQPSGDNPSYGSGNQYGNQFGQSQPGQPPFDQPSSAHPQYGQPSSAQPQYGQPPLGQPPSGQPQYGQPQYGQPQPNQYGQPPYGQASGGWNGQAPGGFGGQPPKKNWLLYGGIGAGVIIVALVVALILQGQGKDDTSPPAPTNPTTQPTSQPPGSTHPPSSSAPETSAPETSAARVTTAPQTSAAPPQNTGGPLPSNAPTDADGVPVIPVTLKGKTVPTTVGNFNLATGSKKQFDGTTALIYDDRTVRPAVAILGAYGEVDIASSVTGRLKDVQRIGNFLCGQSSSVELIYCAAKTSEGTIYFYTQPDTTIATLGALANGVVTGAK